MKNKLICLVLFLVFAVLLQNVFAEDYCGGSGDPDEYESPYNPFPCTVHEDPGHEGDMGNCTWWAAYKRPDLKAVMSGNAAEWLDDAEYYDYVIGTRPRYGAIVVFPSMAYDPSTGEYLGHVAFVTGVTNDTEFEVTEMGYNSWDGVQTNTYNISSSNTDARFIYWRDCIYLNEEIGAVCVDYYDSDGMFHWPEASLNFVQFEKTVNSYDFSQLSTSEGRDYIWNFQRNVYFNSKYVDLAEYLELGDQADGIGGLLENYGTPDIYDPGDIGTTLDGPDANVKEVELSNYGADSYHHTLTVVTGQTFDVRLEITNKGDEDIDYFEVFVHRSPDLDFDEEADFSCGREEEDDTLDAEGGSTAKHRTCTAPTTPGTYYIFGYINRVDGEEGGEDQDWSNNYSRNDDPEEYGVLKVVNHVSPAILMMILFDQEMEE